MSLSIKTFVGCNQKQHLSKPESRRNPSSILDGSIFGWFRACSVVLPFKKQLEPSSRKCHLTEEEEVEVDRQGDHQEAEVFALSVMRSIIVVGYDKLCPIPIA